MLQTNHRGCRCLLLVGIAFGTATVHAAATQTSVQTDVKTNVPANSQANARLAADIDALRAEIAALRSRQGADWLSTERSAQIRDLVQDVLADADSRASLQGDGMTAGWDKGFFLSSPDGNFLLKVSGQVQFRYVLNYRDLPSDTATQDRWSKGFENRRTKLAFAGHVIDRSWTYQVMMAFNRGRLDAAGEQLPDSGTAELEFAWIQKTFEDGLFVRFGQFKPPFLREELVPSRFLLAVERSLVHARFSQGYSQGVEVGVQTDMLRVKGLFSDGLGAPRSMWGESFQNSPWQRTSTEYAFTARAEILAAGGWKQFEDFTSWSSDPFGLLIGAAINWQRAEFGTDGPLLAFGQQLGATADISLEFGGANLFGAFVWANPDLDGNGAPGGDRNDIAFLVQGGMMVVPDALELFGRYEWGDPDLPSQSDLKVLTVGLNWYFSRNAAKFTTDVGFSLDDFGSVYASSGAGWLRGFDEFQLVWRTQFQLLF